MKNVILIMLIISILICVYFGIIRDNKVHKFRVYISNLIYSRAYDMINEEASLKEMLELWSIMDNISYDKMLYSFKPLKMEYWFTEKELKLLKYKGNDTRTI